MRNLDGLVLDLSTMASDEEPLQTPYTSIGRFPLWEVTSCPLDHDVALASSAGITEEQCERFDVADGVLTVLTPQLDEGMVRQAYWRGRHRGVFLSGVGNLDDTASFVEGLAIDDDEDGLAVGGRDWERSPAIKKIVKNVGLCKAMPRGHGDIPPLPAWQGTQVRDDLHMYRGDRTDSAYYVLVYPSAVVTVSAPLEFEAESMANAADLTFSFR